MGYSVVSGELKQIGEAVTTDGIIEASSLEIGGTTLHDIAYNEHIAAGLKEGERVALLLTPTGFIAALRRQNGEIDYSSESNQVYLEEPISYPFYIMLALLAAITVWMGIGVVIIMKMVRSFSYRKDIIRNLTEFKALSF